MGNVPSSRVVFRWNTCKYDACVKHLLTEELNINKLNPGELQMHAPNDMARTYVIKRLFHHPLTVTTYLPTIPYGRFLTIMPIDNVIKNEEQVRQEHYMILDAIAAKVSTDLEITPKIAVIKEPVV